MSTKNIALLAGGFTGEYEVSVGSAKNIADNLDTDQFNVYTILINRDSWFYESGKGKVNIDKNPGTPQKYGVRGIPTLIIFKDGKAVSTKVGSLPKSKLVEWIDSVIA